jgi:predicted CoA-binding protein
VDWRDRLISGPEGLARVLRECRRIAVLGIKPESRRGQPAFYVPEYALLQGYDVVPVPVYYPDVTTILGRPVYRSLAAVPPPVDLVTVFRRPPDIPPHLPDILAARPRAVWLQLGIRHDAVAEALARAGIDVVQDRCLMVEHRRLVAAGPPRGA